MDRRSVKVIFLDYDSDCRHAMPIPVPGYFLTGIKGVASMIWSSEPIASHANLVTFKDHHAGIGRSPTVEQRSQPGFSQEIQG